MIGWRIKPDVFDYLRAIALGERKRDRSFFEVKERAIALKDYSFQ
ncbi:hypothetical protein [Microcoleus sp. D2_18a_D3]